MRGQVAVAFLLLAAVILSVGEAAAQTCSRYVSNYGNLLDVVRTQSDKELIVAVRGLQKHPLQLRVL